MVALIVCTSKGQVIFFVAVRARKCWLTDRLHGQRGRCIRHGHSCGRSISFGAPPRNGRLSDFVGIVRRARGNSER